MARLAWLPPVALLSGAVAVNGIPPCSAMMEFTCHPPTSLPARLLLFRIFPP